MFIQVSLLRPQRGDTFLTYSVPEILWGTVEKGDIVEIPMRNNRELGVVFSVFSESPEFETKNMGKIVQKNFFGKTLDTRQKFLDFMTEISQYFFCSPSFFLTKSAPNSFFSHLPSPPQQKFYTAKNIPEIPEIKGKKQQELCQTFTPPLRGGLGGSQDFQNETPTPPDSLRESSPSKRGTARAENLEISEPALKQKFSSAIIKTALEKEYIQEIFQEKFPEISGIQIGVEEKDTNTTHKFYDLSTLDLDTRKNLIIGSNHSAKNAVLAQWISEKIQKDQQVLFIFPDQISVEQAYEKFQKIFPAEIVALYSSGSTVKNKEELFFTLKSGYTKILLGTKNALFFLYKNLGGNYCA